ncbi:MAG: hypothetical protein J2P27_19960, partial [Actinobacteria bacterium]|nr:hypothetical protein [Actinomycetota bacterium]
MPDTNGSRGWFASMEDLAERPSEEQTAPAGADDGVQEDETGPMPVVSERAGDPGKQRAEVLTPKRQLRPEAQRQSAKPRRSEPRRRPERRGR